MQLVPSAGKLSVRQVAIGVGPAPYWLDKTTAYCISYDWWKHACFFFLTNYSIRPYVTLSHKRDGNG